MSSLKEWRGALLHWLWTGKLRGYSLRSECGRFQGEATRWVSEAAEEWEAKMFNLCPFWSLDNWWYAGECSTWTMKQNRPASGDQVSKQVSDEYWAQDVDNWRRREFMWGREESKIQVAKLTDWSELAWFVRHEMWGEGGSFSLTAAALMIDSVLKRAMKRGASLWWGVSMGCL